MNLPCWGPGIGRVAGILMLVGALRPASGDAIEGLLFHASFDMEGYERLEPRVLHIRGALNPVMGRPGEYPRADFAVGDPLPRNVMGGVKPIPDGRFGGAVRVPSEGVLTFDTFGNMGTRRGTLAFWCRPAAPLWSTYYREGRHAFIAGVRDLQNPLRISPFLTLGVHSRRRQLYLAQTDAWRNRLPTGEPELSGYDRVMTWRPDQEWQPDTWRHVAVVWDAALGRRWYVDGALAGSTWGSAPEHRPPYLGHLALACDATPGHIYTLPLGFDFDELYVFDYPLGPEAIRRLVDSNQPPLRRPPTTASERAARDRWVARQYGLDGHDLPGVDARALTVRMVPIVRARERRIEHRRALDGKINTVWPLEYKSPASAGPRVLTLDPDGPAVFNLVHTIGLFEGRLLADGRPTANWSGDRFLSRRLLSAPVTARQIDVEHAEGSLNNLALFQVGYVSPQDLPPAVREGPLAPAEDAGDLAPALQAYYPPEDRDLWRAGGTPESGRVPVRAFRALHLAGDPEPSDQRFGAFTLYLVREAFEGSGVLSVQVHDPATRTRELLRFEVALPAAGAEARTDVLHFDGPPLWVGAGQRVWITLRFSRAGLLHTGPEKSRLVLHASYEARDRAHRAGLERILCDQFLQLSEPQRWNAGAGEDPARQHPGVGELFTLAEHILRFDPGNRTAASIFSFVLRNRFSRWGSEEAAQRYRDPYEEITLPAVERSGPDWAVYGRSALKSLRRHVDWWINERQDEFGELGSGINDDTCMMPEVVNFALIHDPGDRLRNGLRRLVDRCWEVTLTGGINRRMTDHLHAFEEGTNLLGPTTLLFYGEPEPVERLMPAVRIVADTLTAVNPQGDRLFRSFYFNAAGDIRADLAYDAGWCLVMMPARYLAWYNGNPEALRVGAEWQESFLRRLPAEPNPSLWGAPQRMSIDFQTGALRRGAGPMGMDAHLYWLHQMTGERRYLEVLMGNWRRGLPAANMGFHNWQQWRKVAPDAAVDAALEARGVGPFTAWERGAEDRSALIDSLRESILFMEKYLPVTTWVGQSADRVPIPQNTMAAMFLGGMADKAKRLNYHYHAVSWEGADDDVARFVVTDHPDRLAVLLYSFHDEPVDVTMRVWKLRHGRYRVRAGIDRSGDEQIDDVALDAVMLLARHQPVSFSVPPREVFVVEADQVEELDDIRRRADLALGPRDVHLRGHMLEATVHNLGGADAPESLLQVRRAGRVLAERTIPPLAAPRDLVPRTATVRLALAGIEPGDLEVVVQPPDGVPEITPENNRIVLTLRDHSMTDKDMAMTRKATDPESRALCLEAWDAAGGHRCLSE